MERAERAEAAETAETAGTAETAEKAEPAEVAEAGKAEPPEKAEAAERAFPGWGWRVFGGFAVLWLAAALTVTWLLFGARLGALSGFMPPTGSFAVTGCFEGMEEGDFSCRGRYTPFGAGAVTREDVLLRSADDEHRLGTRTSVRLVGDQVFEPSPIGTFEYVSMAGWTVSTLGMPGLWMLASARRGRTADGDGYVFAWLAALLGAIALGLAVMPLAWVLSLIRG
ncbi:hypothetical protein [Streptomyces omiyaensis]|uniref:hypothetical protein n=1 Tax=Streptomyces omiyaensis TaxID=68247 RepID=UPI0037001A5C